MAILQVGQIAPDFTLPDQDGESHSISEYRGRWVVLYFYPKDDTPGCTTQACGLRDNLSRLNQLDATVIGISTDSVESHRKFADKYHLAFTLLADESKQVVVQYGVWGQKKFMGKQYMGINRTTFILNPHGEIVKAYEHVNPGTHFDQIWSDLPDLQQKWLTAKHT